jgi:TonB-dependent receptor
VTRQEPDRSELVYALDPDPQGNPQPAAWLSASSEGAVRTFGDLNESSTEAQLSHRLLLGRLTGPVQLKVGAAWRQSDRHAANVAYSISSSLPRADRELPAEQIFDGRYNQPGDAWFTVSALGGGGTYDAEETVSAGFAMLQMPLTGALELVGGARHERSATTVRTVPTSGSPVTSSPEYQDLLPSLALNLRLGESHVVRLAASRTLSRPEYRELAPVQYREVIGGENVVGNADLRRALIQNYDLRWEWYPRATEVISIGLFAKSFADPIERIYLATSGTRLVTFVNAESARNYGVEVEVRKNLDLLGEALRPFQAFANATVMHSEITIGGGAASKLNDQRAMVGQAPYVINTGLTYTSTGGRFSATALYNLVGARMVSAAEAPLPDIFEQPRHMLDLALRFPILPGLSGKADFRNLLDAASLVRQGTVTREYYRSGRSFSVGLSWQP